MKIIPHKWYKTKSSPYLICSRCGLVRLRNELTAKAIEYGCDHDEHPQYKKYLAKVKSGLT